MNKWVVIELSTFVNEVVIELLSCLLNFCVVIEPTKKLIFTCSPTLVLTKGTNAHQSKVSSARLIVYTAHFIRDEIFRIAYQFYPCSDYLSQHGPSTGESLVRHG